MHGDLNAHNILFSAGDRALIGDFGAASVYATTDLPIAQGLQQLEVRAFGCLLEELIEQCTFAPEEVIAFSSLNELQSACMNPDHASRPLFDEISEILSGL